ncbi:HPP family protein [Pseudonocardia sp. RS010]|uniref:CBS domain-containing protein n=1 Tax=Pseudonocardia sp. RS010 TaxID=3385979 RepID=UPI0039A32521
MTAGEVAAKVRDAMSTAVTTLRADSPVQAAASVLAAHGRSVAPVVDGGGRLVGMVTAADLACCPDLPEGWQAEVDPEAVVAAVMTHRPVRAQPEDDLAEVVGTMLDAGIRAVPVIDGGRVVGILTRCDVLRLVAARQPRAGRAWPGSTGPVSREHA